MPCVPTKQEMMMIAFWKESEKIQRFQSNLELPYEDVLPPDIEPENSTDLKISKFLPDFLKTEGITSRDDLNLWCKKNGAKPWGDDYRRKPLYNLLRQKCSKDSYSSTKSFEASIRSNYEKLLSGYETSKK